MGGHIKYDKWRTNSRIMFNYIMTRHVMLQFFVETTGTECSQVIALLANKLPPSGVARTETVFSRSPWEFRKKSFLVDDYGLKAINVPNFSFLGPAVVMVIWVSQSINNININLYNG